MAGMCAIIGPLGIYGIRIAGKLGSYRFNEPVAPGRVQALTLKRDVSVGLSVRSAFSRINSHDSVLVGPTSHLHLLRVASLLSPASLLFSKQVSWTLTVSGRQYHGYYTAAQGP